MPQTFSPYMHSPITCTWEGGIILFCFFFKNCCLYLDKWVVGVFSGAYLAVYSACSIQKRISDAERTQAVYILFPTVSHRSVVLISLDMNDVIFENVIVNIKNMLKHFTFFILLLGHTSFLDRVLHVFPKACLRFNCLKSVFLCAWEVPKWKVASTNINNVKANLTQGQLLVHTIIWHFWAIFLS